MIFLLRVVFRFEEPEGVLWTIWFLTAWVCRRSIDSESTFPLKYRFQFTLELTLPPVTSPSYDENESLMLARVGQA